MQTAAATPKESRCAKPAVDLVVSEAPPPGHDPKYEDDAGREEAYPADEDARHNAVPCIMCYDGACTGRARCQSSGMPYPTCQAICSCDDDV